MNEWSYFFKGLISQPLNYLVYLEGFEPPILWSVATRSIQLSHRYIVFIFRYKNGDDNQI